MKRTVITIIAVIFIIFIVFLLLGSFFTNQYVSDELSKLKQNSRKVHPGQFTKKEAAELPFQVRNYFLKVIEEKTEKPRFLSLNQKAQFKTSINSGWKDLTADVYYTPVNPAYLRDSQIEMSEFLWTRAIESYIDGRGAVIIKLLSSLKVTELTGQKVNESSLARYLTESVMFPSALLPSNNLKWRKLDGNKAEVELTHNSNKVKAIFFFNEKHLVEKVKTSNRFRTTRAGFQQTDFTIHYSDYQKADGFTIPTQFEIEWNLPDHKFKFGKSKIENLKFSY